MKRNKKIKPTDAELEILKILWEYGSSTVRFVNDKINEHKKTGYTTTLKFMQIMFEKGMVKRNEKKRSHVYGPVLKEKETIGLILEKFMDTVFEGSAMKLVMQAIGNKRASEEEIKKIKQYLNSLEGGENEGD